jgi:DNA-binding winged helix-turn-helix (wHTH) protein/tetratricopeptide (TPR) repeat protein
MDTPAKRIYEFDRFRVDPGARLLTRDARPIPLPPKAFDLLLMMVSNSGRVVTKDELMRALWPDTFVQDQSLKQNVFLIRKALGEKANESSYIASVHGKGYKFLPKVVEGYESAEEKPPASRVAAASAAIKGLWPYAWFILVITFSLVTLATYVSYRASSRRAARFEPSAQQNGAAFQRRSVAILDIRNLSGNRNEDWLSTAISEMLTTELGAGQQLRMISGEEIARFKLDFPQGAAGTFSRETLTRVRGALGADLSVSGAYTVLGRTNSRIVRIDLRVQDAAAGETVAEISEMGRQDDLFSLVSDAGRRLREKLGMGEIAPVEFASVKAALPANAQVSKLYSEGLARLRAFEPLAARELLERVVRIEPTNSRAHSGLSQAWEMLGYQDRSRDEARKAFELATTLPPGDRLWVEARFYETAKEWDKAIATYTTLFGSYPDSVDDGLRLASADISAGKAKDALTVLQSLRQLPSPARDDPRIDLTEAAAEQSLFDVRNANAAAARAASKGTALGARLIVAQAKFAEAEAATDLQNEKEALADYEEARQLHAAVGNTAGVCQALIGIGNLVQGQDLALAKATFSRVLELAREIGDHRSVARALLDLGNVSYDSGALHKAKTLYDKAFAAYREINDRPGMAGLLLNIGLALDDLGDYKSAETALQQSLAIATTAKLNFDITDAYNTLGTVFYHEGRLSESLAAYNNSLNTARSVHFQEAVVNNLAAIGRVMRVQGEIGVAREKLKEALALRGDSLAPRLELACIELEEHNPAAAEESARKALPNANFRTPDNMTWYTVVAQALLAQGKTAAAKDTMRQAEALGMKQSAFLDARLEFAVNNARVQAALGRGVVASTMLRAAIADARNFGDVPYQLEACNALVAIDPERASFSDGSSCLSTLQQNAATGFVLFAQKVKR